RIAFTWNDVATDEEGFLIERSQDLGANFILLASLGANVTSYADTTVQPFNTYIYRVRSFNAAGYSFWAFSSLTPANPVPAPEPIFATSLSGSQIRLNWNDIYTDEDGFWVERSVDSVNYALIATLGPGVASYIDTGLTSFTTYYYHVRSFN